METRADFFLFIKGAGFRILSGVEGGWDSRQSQPMPEQVYKRVNPVESPEDLALLEDFLAGSAAAFTAIYDRFYPSLFGQASRYVSLTEAEDVCADCFVKLWKSEKAFNSIRGLGVYLRVMVRNACFSRLTEKNRRSLREVEFSLRQEGPVSEELWEESSKRLYVALAKLPPGARKVIELAYLGGHKNSSIAGILQISKSTVKTQKTRAIKLLRGLLSSLIITATHLALLRDLPGLS